MYGLVPLAQSGQRMISSFLFLLRMAGALLLGVAAIGLVALFIRLPANVPGPLVQVEDWALTDTGDIFVSLNFARRLQRYDRNGNFIEGFYLRTAGGGKCIDVQGDRILVSLIRSGRVDVIDFRGTVVPELPKVNGSGFENPCKIDRAIASVTYGYQSAQIKLKSNEGIITIVPMWWHYLLPDPFVLVLLSILGGWIFDGSNRMLARRRGQSD